MKSLHWKKKFAWISKIYWFIGDDIYIYIYIYIYMEVLCECVCIYLYGYVDAVCSLLYFNIFTCPLLLISFHVLFVQSCACYHRKNPKEKSSRSTIKITRWCILWRISLNKANWLTHFFSRSLFLRMNMCVCVCDCVCLGMRKKHKGCGKREREREGRERERVCVCFGSYTRFT